MSDPAVIKGKTADSAPPWIAEIRRVLSDWQTLGLSKAELAGALGVDVRALERWNTGTVPQTEGRRRLADLAALRRHLLDTFEEANASVWLHADSHYLGGMKPVEALAAGRIERVEAALEALDSGIFV